jgi:hypothetical protein
MCFFHNEIWFESFKARGDQAKQFAAKGKAKNNFSQIKPTVCPDKE